MHRRIFEVEIVDLDHKGRGIGYIDERPVKVYFTIPGDTVKIEIVKKRRKEYIGRLLEVKSKSKYRVKPKCKFFGRCGGCKLQNIDYTYQLLFKRKIARKFFQKYGLKTFLEKVTPSDPICNYRNRMDYVVGLNLEVGLREPEKWFRITDIDECHLLSEKGNEFLNVFKDFIRKRKIPAFNAKKKEGFLRYIVLREGKFTSERLINIVSYTGEFNGLSDLTQTLASLGATSIYWSINPRVTDVSYGEEARKIYGSKYLKERIEEYIFNIHPNSFFQTNSYQARNLVRIAQRLLDFKTSDKLLDLYCETGLFGISLHGYVDEVIGLEMDPYAIECANLNAKINEARNISFIKGEAESLQSYIDKTDLVIVDPPRPGLHPKVISSLLNLRPREILYFSCNPITMARDIALLSKKYVIEDKVYLVDMFPHTPHVEAIAKLVKV